MATTDPLKKAVVVADVVAWTVPRQGKPDDPYYQRAMRGDEIELPTSEFDRLAEHGGVAEPEVAEAAQAQRDELDTGLFADDELEGLNATELAAYVTQHPDDARRVWDLEQARSRGPRKTVLAATGYDPDSDAANPVRVTPAVIDTGDGDTSGSVSP